VGERGEEEEAPLRWRLCLAVERPVWRCGRCICTTSATTSNSPALHNRNGIDATPFEDLHSQVTTQANGIRPHVLFVELAATKSSTFVARQLFDGAEPGTQAEAILLSIAVELVRPLAICLAVTANCLNTPGAIQPEIVCAAIEDVVGPT